MIEDLEREGLIKRLPYDKKKVDDSLALAYRDLLVSHVRSFQRIGTGHILSRITRYSRQAGR